MTDQIDTLALALGYLKRHPDRYLAPLKRGSKSQPLIKNNLAGASNDPAQIRAWAKQFPRCNWLVSLKKSGLIAVDVDTKPGKEGQSNWEKIDLLYGWPETERARSPSGGYHDVYEGQHVMAVNGFGLNIDSPNFVVMPGCPRADGGRYVLERDIPAAKAPEWFYGPELLGKAKTKQLDVGDAPLVELDQDHNVEWAKDFLKNDAEPAKEGSGGDDQTYRTALSLRDKAISLEKAVELIDAHYNQRCEPPWPYDDLRKKVENAYAYASQSRMGETTPEADFANDDIDVSLIPTMGDPETLAREAEERKRPRIVVNRADLPNVVRKVQGLLVQSAKKPDALPADQIFQRVDKLVHLSRNRLKEGQHWDKAFHVENDLTIRQVEPDWFADRLERNFAFGRIGKTKGQSGQSKPEFIPTEVPPVIVKRLNAISQDWQYPHLSGTVEAPTLRRDGTILSEPGYDEDSGLYYDPGLTVFPAIPKRPTKRDALAALAVLSEPLADFPFADEDGVEGLSRSVALAMLLTSVCRRTLPTAPMFGVDANEANSGKTLLAQLAAIVMTGRKTAERPLSDDEYQRSNALAAALEAGDPIILFDNIDGDKMAIEGDALCMVLTGQEFKPRRLGGNSAEDQIKAPTNALLVATGNKLTAAGDVSEDRMLICKLRPDQPLADRQYSHWPLDAYVVEQRPALVSAALTILRAYSIAAKEPGPQFRFPEWRAVVADALVWLGLPDPVLSTERVKADDPVKEAQRDVMRAWVRYIGVGESRTTKSALGTPDVLQAIADARGVAPNRLSKNSATSYIKSMGGSELLGYRLSGRVDPHHEVMEWTVTAGPKAVPIDAKPSDESGAGAGGDDFEADDPFE